MDLPPCVLTIAGADPCGGAGVQVDLHVMRDHQCHGLSAITAVVSQNTQGVRRWRACPPELVRDQLLAIAEDIPVAAIKLGMLASPDVVQVVGELLSTHQALVSCPVVCDPVLASGDGTVELGKQHLVEAMQHMLFPHVDVLTPNIPEAETLLGHTIEDPMEAVEAIAGRVRGGVLLKGGHWRGDVAVDWWSDGMLTQSLRSMPRLDIDARGTGCQLSSAIACQLARGEDFIAAIEKARDYLHHLLTHAPAYIGKGKPVIVRID